MFNPSNALMKIFIINLPLASIILSSAAYHMPEKPNITRIKRQSNCGSTEFLCSSGECIQERSLCDGKADCKDSSDETNHCQQLSQRVGCILPKQPKNGMYEYISFNRSTPIHGEIATTNTVLAYTCKDNYALSTSQPITYVICINNDWSHDFPECIKTCPPRVSESVITKCNYQDRVVNCSLPMLEGTTVTMSCIDYFEVTDSSALNPVSACREGSWDRNMLKCEPECGKENENFLSALIVNNGYAAEMGAFPWHVGIYEDVGNKKYEQACGGSLIRMNIVLSAAHCFTDANTGDLREFNLYLVAAGKYYRDLNDPKDVHKEQTSEIKNIQITEHYKGINNFFRDDIAILVLKSPFMMTRVVQPVCVDWANQYENEQLVPESYGDVVGWGFMKADSSPSMELRQLRVPYIMDQQCYKVLPLRFYSYITADKFCAGYTNGSSICRGDSGGGLVFLRRLNNRYYIRGISSSGPQRGYGCDMSKYTLFTKVSMFMKFISRVVSENAL